MRTVYLDGRYVPESEAKLSIYDLSVMQAAAAFEMTRSFKGRTFKLREHAVRLEQSCEFLAIPLPDIPAMDSWFPATWARNIENLCDEVACRNDHGYGEEHRILIVVSPGCAPMYKDLEGVIPHPFIYIADFPLRFTVQGFSRYFTEGVHCVTSKIQQVQDACVPSAAKHRSRLHFHLAQQQAPAGTWPLLLRTQDAYSAGHGYEMYAEAPGANIMYVKDGQVRYVDFNALQGISMHTAMSLTGATAAVGDVRKVRDADELWLTGTPFCMLPVVSLDGKPIGDGTPGPVYKATLAKWSELVGVRIDQQIIDWDNQTFMEGRLWTTEQQRILEARAQRLKSN